MANKKSTKPKTDDAKDSGRNSISVGGNVSRSNIVAGDHNRVTQSVNTQANEIVNYFEVIYRQIETREEDPQVDKEEIVETVQRIEQETAKGEEANPAKVDRWLSTLTDMAPDIGEVVLSTLTNPAAGIATVIRKIAEKAKEGSEK